MATDEPSTDDAFRARLIDAWREAVRRSLWAVPGVADEPEVALHQWRRVELRGERPWWATTGRVARAA